ncbi:MAG: trimethylamine methyltransferase family protein [Chloroflexota bacterium]
MSLVRPDLVVLSEEQVRQVHDYSLEVLRRVGVRVDSDRALNVLSRSKGVKIDNEQVTFQPELVEWALERAPSSLEIYRRTGEPAFVLGNGPTRFGVGVTNLYYQDPATEQVSLFTREHMAIGTRLGEALPAYDCVSTVGVIRDVPAGTGDLYATLEMVANTAKPLVILVSDGKQFEPTLDLLAHLGFDLVDKPFVIPYFNPVTPLIINRETGDKMLEAIDRHLPVIYSNYAMAGMTTPITAAGTLSLLNAELLAGLVLSQLAREGTPVILGSLPAFFDLKTMVEFYDPHTILLNAACAEMMAHYHIPHAGTSGSGIGWGADLPAAGLYWLNHLTACLGKTGLAPFVGGSLGSKAFSPTGVVYANDIIQQVRRFAAGFPLDESSVVLDEIEAVGPGGNFLKAKSTFQHFRQAYYTSPIFPHLSLEKWEEKGHPRASELLKEYTLHLIAEVPPPEDHGELMAKGEEFIRKFTVF